MLKRISILLILLTLFRCKQSNNEVLGNSNNIKQIISKFYYYDSIPNYNLKYLHSEIQKFDSLGKITKKYGIENSQKVIQHFYYDKENRKKEIHTYDKDSTLKSIEKISYHDNDSLKSQIFLNSEKIKESSIIYKYSNNFKEKTISFFFKNKLNRTDNIRFNDINQIIYDESISFNNPKLTRTIITEYFPNYKKSKFLNSNKTLEFTEYSYFENNKHILSKTFNNKNELIEEEIRKYDLNGNQIYCLFIHHKDKTNELYESKYDKSDNEVESKFSFYSFSDKDFDVLKTINTYDKHNNKIKKEEYVNNKNTQVYTYGYKYDTKNNWIQEIDNEYNQITKRKITYY